MPAKFQLITELYDRTLRRVTANYQSWTGFLELPAITTNWPLDEQILIYAQRPDATAVLEMERWNKQFGRWVNRGAKSIAVFETMESMSSNSISMYRIPMKPDVPVLCLFGRWTQPLNQQ